MVARALPRREDTNWEGGYRFPTVAVPRTKLRVAISRRLGVIKPGAVFNPVSAQGDMRARSSPMPGMPDGGEAALEMPERLHQDLAPPIREAWVVARGPQDWVVHQQANVGSWRQVLRPTAPPEATIRLESTRA